MLSCSILTGCSLPMVLWSLISPLSFGAIGFMAVVLSPTVTRFIFRSFPFPTDYVFQLNSLTVWRCLSGFMSFTGPISRPIPTIHSIGMMFSLTDMRIACFLKGNARLGWLDVFGSHKFSECYISKNAPSFSTVYSLNLGFKAEWLLLKKASAPLVVFLKFASIISINLDCRLSYIFATFLPGS